MKFFKPLISLIFIFLILHSDIVVTAHTLGKSHLASVSNSFLSAQGENSLQTEEVRTHLKKSHELSSSVAIKKPSLKEHSKNVVQTKTKILPILIVVIVLVAVIVVAGVAKKIVDKVAENELKEISKEINKAKVEQLQHRKEENTMIIDLCLGFQQLRKLFKAYSNIGLFSKAETIESLKTLATLSGNDLPTKATEKKFAKAIEQAQNKFNSWSNQYERLTQMVEQSFTKFCYDAYSLRQTMGDANILGDYYTGFTESDFSNIDATFSVVKDTVVDQKFGSEVAADILELRDKSEEVGESFSILKKINPDETPKWLSDYSGAGSVLSSLSGLRDSYKEIKEKIEENSREDASGDNSKILNKVLGYLGIAFETVDKVLNLVKGGLSFGGLEFKFPFFSVAAEAAKAAKTLVDYLDSKKSLEEDTSNPKNPGLVLQESLKFWDCLDQTFSFLKELADMIMTLISGVTAGVSKVISYSINALISIVRMVFSAVKLKKIMNMKQQLVTYIQATSTTVTEEANRIKAKFINEKCSVYLSLMKMMIEKEFAELADMLNNKKKSFSELSEGKDLSAQILQSKVKMVKQICTNDKDYCPEFLENMELDKSFINDGANNLQGLVSGVSFEKAHGDLNSLVSVFKGKFASSSYTDEDKAYASHLALNLIKNGYHPIFESPRYVVFGCSLCAKDDISVQAIANFIQPNEITRDTNFDHIQDTLQFVNLQGTELAEYFVAKLKTKPAFAISSAKFSEITFSGSVTETTRHFLFWNRETLLNENYRIPIDITVTKRNYLRNFEDLLILSIHQQKANSVINYLKGQANVNIISSKVILKVKQDFPSHYLFLVAVKKGSRLDLKSEIETVCENPTGKWVYKCQIQTVMSNYNTEVNRKADFANFDYQFYIFSEHLTNSNPTTDFQSGITLAGFTSNGWRTLGQSEKFQLTKENDEHTRVTLLYKPVMRFQEYPANPSTKTDVSILSNIAMQEAEIRLKIFTTLSETVCSDECQTSLTLPPRRKSPILNLKNFINNALNPTNEDKSVCTATETDWKNVLQTKSFHAMKDSKCSLGTQKETDVANFWDSIYKGFPSSSSSAAIMLADIKSELCPAPKTTSENKLKRLGPVKN